MLCEALDLRVDSDLGEWRVATFTHNPNRVWEDSQMLQRVAYKNKGILDKKPLDDRRFDEWDQFSTRFALYRDPENPEDKPIAGFRYIEPQLSLPAPLQVAAIKFPDGQDLYGQARKELLEMPHELSGVWCDPSCQHNPHVIRDMIRAVYQTSLVFEIRSWIGIFDVAFPTLLARHHNVFFNTFDGKDSTGKRNQRVDLHEAWRVLTYANREDVLTDVRRHDEVFYQYIVRPIKAKALA